MSTLPLLQLVGEREKVYKNYYNLTVRIVRKVIQNSISSSTENLCNFEVHSL